ncbi:MAG: S1/P1 Nuclease [Thermoanaerobaculia bacterium]
MSGLTRKPDFSALSIHNLLEARELYHVHLANMRHVVGTAIGRYLIREGDPDATDADRPLRRPGPAMRTLANTVIREWSWPCVLVFVDHWSTPEELRDDPASFIPPRLYLPDGRVVPTCVVYAAIAPRPGAPLFDLRFADGLVGGGYPVLSNVQGEDHIGSLGCLVTDGHSVFALTNRHVAGPPGQTSYTVADGERVRLGESAGMAIGKIEFGIAYPGWPGLRTAINLDAGLIRVDDLAGWTAQVYGIGRIGTLLDANVDTLSLDVVASPVRAWGGASGELLGQIRALFYRYRSVGGFDYVADFLIGPRDGAQTVPTRPGDSGTLWFWDPPVEGAAGADGDPAPRPPLEPLALQWGGRVLEGPGGQERSQFALASSLATVCRTLDLELVTDWQTGHSEYWGKIGHYKIGAKACDVVADAKLFRLMQANVERVSLSDAALEAGELPMNNQEAFVALADVPDLVWRQKRGMDKANHFADMDEPGAGEFAGKTLLELWREDPGTLAPATWSAFYDSLGETTDSHRGALPFRVRQLYREMVDAVRARDMLRYVGAAGVLAHYVGDACQPLHVSSLHHGRPGHPEEERVHSIYETSMLDRFRVELVEAINDALDGLEIAERFEGDAEAAQVTVMLMDFTTQTLPPIEVIEAYNAEEGAARIPHMWQVLGPRTVRCMVEGILYLAEIWESAWIEGGGAQVPVSLLLEQDRDALRRLYLTKTWVESHWLDDMTFEA